MQIRVKCPECNATFKVPAEFSGREAECSRCQGHFVVKSIDGSALAPSASGSDVTQEIPVYAGENSGGDTDEFEVPPLDISEDESQSAGQDSEIRRVHPQKKRTSPPGKKPDPAVAAAGPPSVVDDDSLFDDELPQLADIPDPVSPFAHEDEDDPDAGGSYSIQGEDQEDKDEGKVGNENSDGGAVELFDDVLRDDEDHAASAEIVLSRSGTFTKPESSPAKASSDTEPTTRLKARKPQKSESVPADKPARKRRSGQRHEPAHTEDKSPRKSRGRRTNASRSPRELATLIAGGVALLLIAVAYSQFSSGPAAVNPTLQGGPITTGQTTSSVERSHQTRSAPDGPNRVDAGEKPQTGSPTTGAVQAEADTAESAAFDGRFPVADVPVPEFPDLGVPRGSTVAGVVYHEISLGDFDAPARNAPPGSRMDMILYLPNGVHDRGSLPCILIAAAGTALLEGNGCFDESYQAETLPYVQQGFAVLGYSLDGALPAGKPSNRELATAYQQFRAAHAGLVNSRNALEFVLQKVPQVNPDQIYAAGHSSAGTLALLFAEHEARLAGCLAYAPCVDVAKRLTGYTSNPLVALMMPGAQDFAAKESPLEHLSHLRCPVFLFHASDDTNTPISETVMLSEKLTGQNTPCQFESVPDGGHYDAMVQRGIPLGIEWLRPLTQINQT